MDQIAAQSVMGWALIRGLLLNGPVLDSYEMTKLPFFFHHKGYQLQFIFFWNQPRSKLRVAFGSMANFSTHGVSTWNSLDSVWFLRKFRRKKKKMNSESCVSKSRFFFISFVFLSNHTWEMRKLLWTCF